MGCWLPEPQCGCWRDPHSIYRRAPRGTTRFPAPTEVVVMMIVVGGSLASRAAERRMERPSLYLSARAQAIGTTCFPAPTVAAAMMIITGFWNRRAEAGDLLTSAQAIRMTWFFNVDRGRGLRHVGDGGTLFFCSLPLIQNRPLHLLSLPLNYTL